jgi:hypothetical protein
MTYTISQLQSEELLLEHAKSSYNITLLGKYEWVLILIFILIGVGTLLFAPEHRTYAIVPLAIGIIESIKYPKRVERWVAKKKTEKKFNKEILFELVEQTLSIAYEGVTKQHRYQDMRSCWISDTGILFKVSFEEYYYISFRSLSSNVAPTEIIAFLKGKFLSSKIVVKYKTLIEELHAN